MIIAFDQEKILGFNKVIESHDFSALLGFTNKYKGFEQLNLESSVKKSLLNRLSTANYRQVPTFLEFWKWFKEKHGMEVAKQLCEFMFPGDAKTSQYMVNCMRNNKMHDWWNHIKSRVYKKWCSILTEMQCVYAIVKGSTSLKLSWQVMADAQLDAMGIDFVIVQNKKAFPVQIKKDSFNPYVQIKHNNKENFSHHDLNKKASALLEKKLNKNGLNVDMQPLLILKYGLPEAGKPAYEYLTVCSNGFVCFHPTKTVKALCEFFH